jgi:seryl-tRNA synthetase
MADDGNHRVEDAFQTLVSITGKSGNLRKDLKNDILVSVSTLRKEFSQLKIQLENVNNENKKLTVQVTNETEEETTRRDSRSARQVAHLWTTGSS